MTKAKKTTNVSELKSTGVDCAVREANGGKTDGKCFPSLKADIKNPHATSGAGIVAADLRASRGGPEHVSPSNKISGAFSKQHCYRFFFGGLASPRAADGGDAGPPPRQMAGRYFLLGSFQISINSGDPWLRTPLSVRISSVAVRHS